MNVTARVRIIMLKNEASHLNVRYRGLAEDLVSEPGWRGAVREGIDSAGKVKPVSSQQPTPFSLLSLGHLFWETMWVLLSARTELTKWASHALNPAQVGTICQP